MSRFQCPKCGSTNQICYSTRTYPDKIIRYRKCKDCNERFKTYEKLPTAFKPEFILKKNGLLTVCSLKNDSLKQAAKYKNFKVKLEKEIWSGKQPLMVTVFQKGTKSI